MPEPDVLDRPADHLVVDRLGRQRIGHRTSERPERHVGPLRHHEEPIGVGPGPPQHPRAIDRRSPAPGCSCLFRIRQRQAPSRPEQSRYRLRSQWRCRRPTSTRDRATGALRPRPAFERFGHSGPRRPLHPGGPATPATRRGDAPPRPISHAWVVFDQPIERMLHGDERRRGLHHFPKGHRSRRRTWGRRGAAG